MFLTVPPAASRSANDLQVQITSASNGRCTAEVTVTQDNCNFYGGLLGCMSASLVDVMSTYALLTLRDVRSVNVDMSIRWVQDARLATVNLFLHRTVLICVGMAFNAQQQREKRNCTLSVQRLSRSSAGTTLPLLRWKTRQWKMYNRCKANVDIWVGVAKAPSERLPKNSDLLVLIANKRINEDCQIPVGV